MARRRLDLCRSDGLGQRAVESAEKDSGTTATRRSGWQQQATHRGSTAITLTIAQRKTP